MTGGVVGSGIPEGGVICGRCRLPLAVHLLPDGRVGQVIQCDCRRVPEALVQAFHDLPGGPTAFEDIGRKIGRTTICHSCASIELEDISRYSTFFCRPCSELIRAAHALLGQVRISLGRHSLVNIIRPVEDPSSLPDAAWTVAGIFSGRLRPELQHPLFEHVAIHRETVVPARMHLARQIGQLVDRARDGGLLDGPPDADVPMRAYLDAAERLWVDHAQAVIDLASAIAAAESEQPLGSAP